MRRTLSSLALAAGLLAATSSACQQPPSAPEAPSSAEGDVGSVAFQLTLASNYHFSSLSYDISGNGFHAFADVDVQHSTTFTTTVGGIPFGQGYVAKLTAREADGKLTPCLGTATFDVTSRAPVSVTVPMTCREIGPPPAVPVPPSAVVVLALLLAVGGAMRLGRRASALGVVLLASATLGCVPPPEAGPEGQDDAGRIRVALQLAPGVTLGSVSYTITGALDFTRSGAIDTSQSATTSAIIAGLPAGSGFSIALRSTSAEGDQTCAGSATFSVTAHVTTPVAVHVLCHEAPSHGTAVVRGAVNVCPSIETVLVEAGPGGLALSWNLSAVAHDSDGDPAAIAYHWTVGSGATLGDVDGKDTVLTCTVSDLVPVTVAITDGTCPDSAAIDVDCTF